MQTWHGEFLIRDWQPGDRQSVAYVITTVLMEFGLSWEPTGADRDVVQVEQYYQQAGGQFWVVEHQEQVIGTAAYHPIDRGEKAVEIRKMYLLPQARGQGLGRFLLTQLEAQIAAQGFETIWIETATIMQTAVKMYEQQGYQPATGVATQRCDRVYVKHLQPQFSLT